MNYNCERKSKLTVHEQVEDTSVDNYNIKNVGKQQMYTDGDLSTGHPAMNTVYFIDSGHCSHNLHISYGQSWKQGEQGVCTYTYISNDAQISCFGWPLTTPPYFVDKQVPSSVTMVAGAVAFRSLVPSRRPVCFDDASTCPTDGFVQNFSAARTVQRMLLSSTERNKQAWSGLEVKILSCVRENSFSRVSRSVKRILG